MTTPPSTGPGTDSTGWAACSPQRFTESLQSLLDEWERLAAAGQEVSPETLCPDRPELAADLRRCIEELKRFERFGSDPASAATEPFPDRIGPYRIRSKIARGGCSVLFAAEQDFPSRRVALKLLNGIASIPRVHARFRLEVRFLASLAHPGIVQVFDAGVVEIGGEPRAYIVMEWVDGQSVADHVRCRSGDSGWSPRDTIRLFLGYCDALGFVHRHGIIHRDIKPGNLMVTADGHPKLIDFGIARLKPEFRPHSLSYPTSRAFAGTRPYMSPEQFDDTSAAVDARSDVYSLGVVLYELLAERLPYDLCDASVLQAANVIRHVAATPLGRVDRCFRGDLEVILGTALAKLPDERYRSMREFADDLGRYLAGEPIHARRPTAIRHLRAWCNRHPVAAVFSAAAALSLLLVTAWAMTAERVAARRSEELRELNGRLSVRLEQAERTAVNQAFVRLGMLAERRPTYVLSRLEELRDPGRPDQDFTRNLLRRAASRRLARWPADREGLLDVAIADDGSWLASSGPQGLWVWDVARREKIAGFPQRLDSPNVRLVIRSQSRQVLFSRLDGKVGRLDLDAGAAVALAQRSEGRPTAIASLPDADGYLIADDRGWVECRGEVDGELRWAARMTDSAVIGLTVASDRRRIGMVTKGGEVMVARLSDGGILQRTETGRDGLIRGRCSADLRHALCTREQGLAFVWDLEADRASLAWRHRGFLPDVVSIGEAPDADGPRYAVSGRGQVELWDRERRTATPYESARPGTSAVGSDRDAILATRPESEKAIAADPLALHASADGRLLAVALRGGDVVIERVHPTPPFHHWDVDANNINALAFSPGGDTLAVSCGNGSVRLLDCETGQITGHWESPTPRGSRQVFFTRDDRLLTVDRRSGVAAWQLPAGTELWKIDAPASLGKVLPVGERIWIGFDETGPRWLSPVGTRRPGMPIDMAESSVETFRHWLAVAGHGPSGMVAAVDDRGRLSLWESPAGRTPVKRATLSDGLGPLGAPVTELAFRRDGKTLIGGTGAGTLLVWNLPSPEPVHIAHSNATRVGGLAVSPTGALMACGHADGELVLWDTETWEPQLYLQTGLEPIRCLEFSPTGDRLAVGGHGDRILLYDGRLPGL